VNARVKTNSYAGFIDATYPIIDKLYLTGGVRYSSDHLVETFNNFPTYLTEGASTTFSAVTPRAILRYQFDDRQSAYFSYNEGYKVGAFNAASGVTTPVKPETNDAFEIGYKKSAEDWTLQLAAFYSLYRNKQIDSFQGPVLDLLNAGQIRSVGFEGSGTVQITNAFLVNVGVSYVNAIYTKFDGAPLSHFSPITGITVTSASAAGNPVENSPEFQLQVGATYTKEFSAGSLTFHANLSFQTTEYYDAFKVLSQPPYALLGMRAAWSPPDKKWSAAVFVKNLTDQKYVTALFEQAVDFNATYGPPREVGVEFSRHF
jgi:iron complex outermembrane receptor protein